jgi:NADP-dependent 3-hydroxy acid dehydrogenase YdfG
MDLHDKVAVITGASSGTSSSTTQGFSSPDRSTASTSTRCRRWCG